MIRRLSRLLFGARRRSSPKKDGPLSSTSSASTTEAPLVGADLLRTRPRVRLRRQPRASRAIADVEDERVGPVDPLDPLKRDRDLPGADPVVPPVPPEV